MFPKLRALDGNRKACEAINLPEAIPDMDEDESSYNVKGEQWYDEDALLKAKPEAPFFETSRDQMREENSMNKEMTALKALLNKTTNVLSL